MEKITRNNSPWTPFMNFATVLMQYADWREKRKGTHWELRPALYGCWGQQPQKPGYKPTYWMEPEAQKTLRVRDAQDLIRMDHNGWYTDDFCEDTMQGVVILLSHGRALAGYRFSCNGGLTVDGRVYDDPKEAAQQADEMARIAAEQEQEYQRDRREKQEAADELERAEEALEAAMLAADEARKDARHCAQVVRAVGSMQAGPEVEALYEEASIRETAAWRRVNEVLAARDEAEEARDRAQAKVDEVGSPE